MAFTLNATVGDPAANAYETVLEGQAYFDSRLPMAGWDNPPGGDQGVIIVMATRTLDALAQPFKTFFPASGGSPAYYRVRRQWTGLPATPTQRLAWPRIGMFDHNGNPQNLAVLSISVDPTAAIVTTVGPHLLTTGMPVLFYGTNSTPIIDGPQVITVTGPTTFTVPVATTVAGTSMGGLSWIPQALKDATAEFAGQLGNQDRTLDNDVIVQGITSIKAGSVALGFKQEIIPQVIPDAVFNLLPQSWLTDELYIMANAAFFDLASRNPSHPTDRELSEGWWP